MKAIYPGTFDPITNGHLDIIQRSARLFDSLLIAIFDNPGKPVLFDLDERIDLVRQSLGDIINVKVIGFADTLLTDFAKEQACQIIVRGLRAVSDFEYEMGLSQVNRQLAPELETIFLMTSEKYAFLSSTMVKEVARFGGDISQMTPPPVQAALRQHFQS